MDKESIDYYHYQIMGNGDVWLNTGTLEEPHWELMMPDYEKQGIAINEEPHNIKVHETMNKAIPNVKYEINWDGPLVKSRNFGYMDKLIRDLGKLRIEEDIMQDKISYVCDSIRDMLLDKNESYGNSALDPVRIFSDADADEQLRTQIDHKLSRIQKGHDYENEDTILDLIGYLILLKIAREQ